MPFQIDVIWSEEYFSWTKVSYRIRNANFDKMYIFSNVIQYSWDVVPEGNTTGTIFCLLYMEYPKMMSWHLGKYMQAWRILWLDGILWNFLFNNGTLSKLVLFSATGSKLVILRITQTLLIIIIEIIEIQCLLTQNTNKLLLFHK